MAESPRTRLSRAVAASNTAAFNRSSSRRIPKSSCTLILELNCMLIKIMSSAHKHIADTALSRRC
ncbi:hypothetical protein E2C01_035179 [Portunus trituberculatus]|uniref:Uncharacterized protein n=1 Tax=Portunus trituberculatus TaxID=210409 RepID=A0A5B7F2H7_PORTR|nr:hypothetical protein [Portunus trituberculatus]